MLSKKQKRNFVIILIIMLVSAGLSQRLPIVIGELTPKIKTKVIYSANG